MRTTYLASPLNRLQATHLHGMPVLLSFALWRKWHPKWLHVWGPMLLDSGAYSEFNSGKKVDIQAYADFAAEWGWRFDAIAGLDDISGDWKRSLENYEVLGFPTFHNTDPPELLDDLVSIARERGGWMGLGIAPVNGDRRYAKQWLLDTLKRMPTDIHVHGWAMRAFRAESRLDSVDSTNWYRDAHCLLARGMRLAWLTDAELRDIEIKASERQRYNRLGTHWPTDALQLRVKRTPLKWLSEGECLEIVVKRYRREGTDPLLEAIKARLRTLSDKID